MRYESGPNQTEGSFANPHPSSRFNLSLLNPLAQPPDRSPGKRVRVFAIKCQVRTSSFKRVGGAAR